MHIVALSRHHAQRAYAVITSAGRCLMVGTFAQCHDFVQHA